MCRFTKMKTPESSNAKICKGQTDIILYKCNHVSELIIVYVTLCETVIMIRSWRCCGTRTTAAFASAVVIGRGPVVLL